MFRKGDLIHELEVSRIIETTYNGIEFPGFDKVHLTYEQLRNVIEGSDASYRNALEKRKAVYVLSDTNNGKLYVGSATSDNKMLLSRWRNYIKSCTGQNVKLENLAHEFGVEYFKKYFTFTIIEHFDQNTDDKYILARESYWKDVLRTRGDHGYNGN